MGSSSFHFAFYPNWLITHSWTASHIVPILYLTIVFLSIIVYKLGFARKLPLLKSLIIYVFLMIGCGILTILALQLPIVGALFFSALVLIIYKWRLFLAKRHENAVK